MKKIKVIFVCLGNICRSPMAEGVFTRLVADAGLDAHFEIDSAGTGGWHVGEAAHPGTRAVLVDHGIDYRGRARQVVAADMADPRTYVLAMDGSNLDTLRSRFGHHARLYRLLDFAPELGRRDVPDPYYDNNFAEVYRLVEAGCQGLLATIRQNENLPA